MRERIAHVFIYVILFSDTFNQKRSVLPFLNDLCEVKKVIGVNYQSKTHIIGGAGQLAIPV